MPSPKSQSYRATDPSRSLEADASNAVGEPGAPGAASNAATGAWFGVTAMPLTLVPAATVAGVFAVSLPSEPMSNWETVPSPSFVEYRFLPSGLIAA